MTDKTLPAHPKAALEAYLGRLNDEYLSWYTAASRRNKYLWMTAQIVAVVAGFATAIVAALIDHLGAGGSTLLRVLLIVLPIVGSFSATLLVQTRALERKALREHGRQRIQGLLERAKADFAEATTNEGFTAIHQKLINEVQDLEAKQAMEFVRIAPEAGPTRAAAPNE